MKMTCVNCCKIFKTRTHCPVCGSQHLKKIIIINEKNNK